MTELQLVVLQGSEDRVGKKSNRGNAKRRPDERSVAADFERIRQLSGDADELHVHDPAVRIPLPRAWLPLHKYFRW